MKKPRFRNPLLIFGVLLAIFFAAQTAAAQRERATRLRSGVAVRGEIGGDGHHSYVIRVRKGQTLTVRITRRVPRDGNFNLTVSRNADFFSAGQVKFGKTTSTRTQLVWTSKVRATGNYYIYITGYNPNEPHVISFRLTAMVR